MTVFRDILRSNYLLPLGKHLNTFEPHASEKFSASITQEKKREGIPTINTKPYIF